MLSAHHDSSAASTHHAAPNAKIVSLSKLEAVLRFGRDDIKRVASCAPRFYKPFDRRRIGTRSWRHIDNPTGPLRVMQGRLHRHLAGSVSLPETMFGVTRGGPAENAAVHLRQRKVVTLDLRSCFRSTSHRRVYDVFIGRLGCSPDIARLLTRLTTLHGCLPHGSPTSPILASLTLLPLEAELSAIAAEQNLALSIYVDDITISGHAAFRALEMVLRTVHRHGHSVRRRKLRRMPNWSRQRVTGIVVNRKLSVGGDRRRRLAEEVFTLASKQRISDSELHSVRGKIAYVHSVCPTQAAGLVRLADRLLPVVGTTDVTPRVFEIRSCTRTRRHREEATAEC